MNARERILAALKGQPTDRPCWCPFLAYWWEAQRPEVTDQGMLSFLEGIGADPMLRGFGTAWNVKYHGLETAERVKGDRKLTRWETPVGALEFGSTYSRDANSWFLVDHPVKTVEDLKVLSWVYEHAELSTRPELEEELKRVSDRGLMVPLVGAELKTCFQSLVEKYAGTVNLTYLLADDPEEVEACLGAMRRVSDETASYCANSSGEAFIFWEDSSTTNISPSFFKRYTAPEIEAWGNRLHGAGKLLIHHACGHLRDLLPLMGALPVDAIESISPPPTGNIDIDSALKLIPDHVALVGGIEPVFFQNCTMEELEERVDWLLEQTKSSRYVLANSDSCPPGVSLEKLRFVSELVRRVQTF